MKAQNQPDHPAIFPDSEDDTRAKQQLFEIHEEILLQDAGRRGWRIMPEGGAAAVEAGLVRESDPAWMYSDDPRASNGFSLTDLGREIMIERGYACRCTGCFIKRSGPTVTDQEYCPNCEEGIRQYGEVETPVSIPPYGMAKIVAGVSCTFHARMMRDEEESP